MKWTDLGLTVTHHGNKNSAAKLDPAKTHTTMYTGKFSGMETRTTRAGMRSYTEKRIKEHIDHFENVKVFYSGNKIDSSSLNEPSSY